MSPACRCSSDAISPVWWRCGRGLRWFGRFGVNLGVLFAREPLNMRVTPLIGTSTPRCAPGRHCLRAGHRAYVRVRGPRCRSSGLRASSRAHVRRRPSQKQKGGLTARRPPDALNMPRETTEEGPRRVPPLAACRGRTVGAEKPPLQLHVVSYNPQCRHCSCNKKSTPEIGCRYFLWS